MNSVFLDKIQRLIYIYGMFVYATNNLSLFTCLNIDSSYIVLHFLKSILFMITIYCDVKTLNVLPTL